MTHLKDYYRLLELEPSATQAEIRKAYRRLALIHHPDKNAQDPYAAALFTEIKEAYEVLSNPARKELYLQQRWYNHSTGNKKKASVVTPVTVLKEALELNKYAAALDAHRMHQQGYFNYLIALASDEQITMLEKFDEPAVKNEIAATLIRSSYLLTLQQFEQLAIQLRRLTQGRPDVELQIATQRKSLERQHQWEQLRPWIAIVIVLALSLMIFLLS